MTSCLEYSPAVSSRTSDGRIQQYPLVNQEEGLRLTKYRDASKNFFSDTFFSKQVLISNDIGMTWLELLDTLEMIDILDCDPRVDISNFVTELNNIREQEPYKHMSFLLDDLSSDNKRSLLVGLAQILYDRILPMEEDFVIKQLHDSDARIQGWALNTIQCWGRISDLKSIFDIKISNKYVREELNDFISRCKR